MKRGLSITMTMLLTVAGVGFLVGTRGDWPRRAGYQLAERGQLPGIPARSYREQREIDAHPNLDIYLTARDTLIGLLPQRSDPVPPRGADDEALALRRRSERRAFDGAPPTIPHRVEPRAMPNCLVCHERGAKIGSLIAPALSHPSFSNCQQCHVERVAPEPIASPSNSETFASAFESEPFGGLGTRAWPGAPPTMPHSGFMRQRCDSCHGVTGAPGLRTSHPARQSCQQCHAPSALLELGMEGFSRVPEPQNSTVPVER
jgi:cytochrome c-type protein NapB